METILPHQKRVIKTIADEQKFNKFLLFHSTGSGKTTTALLTAFDTNCDVIVLTPKTTTSDWMTRIEVVKSFFDSINLNYDGTVIVSGYNYFLNNPAALDKIKNTKTVLIVDEAHNLRKPLKSKRYFNDIIYDYYMGKITQESRDYIYGEFNKNKSITDSDKWILLLNEIRRIDPKFTIHEDMKFCKKKQSTWFVYLATILAYKTLFLTATPIINNYPDDIKNLSLMLYRTPDFKSISIHDIKKTILYYDIMRDPKYADKFPKVYVEDQLIKDSNYVIQSGIPEYTDFSRYGFLIAANIISRLSISALLEYIGPKITRMIDILDGQLPTKVFVHSRWVEHGIKKVYKNTNKYIPKCKYKYYNWADYT